MSRWIPLLVVCLSGCAVLDKSLWRVEVKGEYYRSYGSDDFFGRGIDQDWDDSDEGSEVEVPDWSKSDDTRWTLVFEHGDHKTLVDDLYEGMAGSWEGPGGPIGISRIEGEESDDYYYGTTQYVTNYSYSVLDAKDRKLGIDVFVTFSDGSTLDAELKMKGFGGKDKDEEDPYCTYGCY